MESLELWTRIALQGPLLSPGSDRPQLSLCWGVAAERELTLVCLGANWLLEEVALSKNVVCEGERVEERIGGRRRGKGRGRGRKRLVMLTLTKPSVNLGC